jgi:hypothetical protein
MSPKKKIALFLALTFGLSALSYVPILVTGSLYSMGGHRTPPIVTLREP